MQVVGPVEVEIATFHDIEGAYLDRQGVEHIELVPLAVADVSIDSNSRRQ